MHTVNFYKPLALLKKFLIPNSILLNCKTLPAYSSECCTDKPDKFGRHCYHEEVEKGVNEQILAELDACYMYLSMACFFGRTEIALPGFQTFFMCMHEEEHGHAMMFINYQILRGGHVKLYPIVAPECQNWGCIQKALQVSLDMEKCIKEKLVSLHGTAEKHLDLQLTDIISTEFMPDQNHSICEFARLLTRSKKMTCNGIGEFLFDKEIYEIYIKKCKTCKSIKGDTSKAYI